LDYSSHKERLRSNQQYRCLDYSKGKKAEESSYLALKSFVTESGESSAN